RQHRDGHTERMMQYEFLDVWNKNRTQFISVHIKSLFANIDVDRPRAGEPHRLRYHHTSKTWHHNIVTRPDPEGFEYAVQGHSAFPEVKRSQFIEGRSASRVFWILTIG